MCSRVVGAHRQQASKPAAGAGPDPSLCPVTTRARVMKPETFIRVANVGELEGAGPFALSANG